MQRRHVESMRRYTQTVGHTVHAPVIASQEPEVLSSQGPASLPSQSNSGYTHASCTRYQTRPESLNVTADRLETVQGRRQGTQSNKYQTLKARPIAVPAT